MTTIERILVTRDELSSQEAKEVLTELRERFNEGEDPDELLYEIGLEPDYLFELIY
jgi:hypothetical protein